MLVINFQLLYALMWFWLNKLNKPKMNSAINAELVTL